MQRSVEQSRRSSATRTAWLAVASVAVGTFAMVTTEFLPIGLLGAMAADLHIGIGSAGLLVSVPGLMAAIAAPTLGSAARRVDRRLVLLSLSVLIAISNLIAAAAPSFAIVMLSRVLLGLSVGGFWTFAAAAARRLVDEQRGARAVSLVLTGISAGTVFGVPIGTMLGFWAGWRAAFATVGLLTVAVAIAQAALIPAMPVRADAQREGFGPILRLKPVRVGLDV